MKEVYDFLKDCGIFFIATEDGDQPKLRPFGAINIFEDKLYINTRKTKDVSKQMQKNPKIEICGFKDGKWIRVTAKAVRDDRLSAKKDMLDHYPNIKKNFSADSDDMEVLYLKDVKAVINSFDGQKKIKWA